MWKAEWWLGTLLLLNVLVICWMKFLIWWIVPVLEPFSHDELWCIDDECPSWLWFCTTLHLLNDKSIVKGVLCSTLTFIRTSYDTMESLCASKRTGKVVGTDRTYRPYRPIYPIANWSPGNVLIVTMIYTIIQYEGRNQRCASKEPSKLLELIAVIVPIVLPLSPIDLDSRLLIKHLEKSSLFDRSSVCHNNIIWYDSCY